MLYHKCVNKPNGVLITNWIQHRLIILNTSQITTHNNQKQRKCNFNTICFFVFLCFSFWKYNSKL